MKLYPNTEHPEERSRDLNGVAEEFSEDVITVDDEGMMCIAFWNFDTKEWGFHTDYLYESYPEVFVWMYRPDGFVAPKREKEEVQEANPNRWEEDEIGEYHIYQNKEYFPF